jgi:hypothetical protein
MMMSPHAENALGAVARARHHIQKAEKAYPKW